MCRGIVVSLLCLLAMPVTAQYNVRKMMEEGRRTLDEGYYVTSMQIFSRIVALKPNLYEAWYLMALSKYHLEDYRGAGDDCRRALSLQPYIADIFELYGMTNIREERYDSAIVAYTHALEISPDNRDYWFNRVYCLYRVGDTATALTQLDYILTRWHDFGAARQLRADILAGRQPMRQPAKSGQSDLLRLRSMNRGSWLMQRLAEEAHRELMPRTPVNLRGLK
ncbi:MAG: tetratricopeptide repeat protein [Prevotella sp.]|nr:tetratricopeptide repeat protein [Prevotella sp.]